MSALKNFLFPKISTVQLDSLLKHSPTVVLGNFFMGIANVAIFWGDLNSTWLSVWSIILFLVMIFRVTLGIKYKSSDKALISNNIWHGWFVLSSFIQGLCWLTLSMYAILNLEMVDLTILVISISGLIGGSIATTSSSVQAFVSFSAPTLFPLASMIFYSEQSTAKMLGILAIIYFTLVVRAAFDINSIMLQSIQNNKELKEAKQRAESLAKELYKLSMLDALTQIANRRGFDDTIEKEWRRASRNKTGLSLLMIDVDNFKQFNDHYGHPAGDECLKKVAKVLSQSVNRSADYVARYGGEEFAVILPDTLAGEAMSIARKMCQAITNEKIAHPTSNYLSVSIGVANLDSYQKLSEQDLIKLADDNLYEAKASGRNCAVG